MDLHGELAIALAGRYEIERELGRGGMAVVYLAYDAKHGRRVALKVMSPELVSAVGAERFLREIALAAPLTHPNILSIYDSGEAAGALYYVMPFVEGPTLRQRLEQEKQLPIAEALAIARQIAAALDYAHAHGVVHRDIKPENILLLGEHVLVADFGLARAVSGVANASLTRDHVVGTPAYMSPEQCTPGHVIDGRSDVYSLACTVFEMIAGDTPFRVASSMAMIWNQLATAPPSLCKERQGCPPGLDRAVQRALSKAPADRFETAGEFVRAMSAEGHAATLAGTWARRPRRRWLISAALVIALVALSAWLTKRATAVALDAPVALDTMRVALFPLEGATSGAAPENELLYEAFARWQDLVLVDPFQVTDAVRRHGRIASDEDARAVAKALGAGRYVRGRVVSLGDSVSIRAGLYDVGRAEALQVGNVHAAATQTNAPTPYHRLADTLLLRGLSSDVPSAGGGHRSLAAMQAFAGAQGALDDFDLPRADSALEVARGADASFARASLWLAQVRAWRRMPNTTWRDVARRALTDSAQLGAHDRDLARALIYLGDGEFARACRTYDDLLRRNELDFSAWFGLGQCHTMDRLVVADAASPSRWRFRSSYGAGLRAYEHALKLLPSAHRGFQSEAFASLRELLLTDRDRLVSGYSVGPDSARFFARLAWMGDTVALIPYPWQQITGGTRVYPPGFDRALAAQREAFRQIASSWAVALPAAAAAKEALALSLEMQGDPTAADTLRVARRLTTDPSQRLQLGAAEVIVRVKFAIPNDLRELQAARALGDSLLARDATVSGPTAQQLAVVAELLGRCERAVALSRRAAVALSRPLPIPRQYNADAAELRTRAALGCQRPNATLTVASLSSRIRHDGSFATPHTWRIAEEILLVAAAHFSFPADRQGIDLLHDGRDSSLIGAMHYALAGNARRARRTLEALEASHGTSAPRVDAALPESRVWLALGDTAHGSKLLRQSLDAVAAYEPRTLASPARAGALARAMAQHAALERATGDRARARSWAAAVITLWSGADASLQPVVREMKLATGN